MPESGSGEDGGVSIFLTYPNKAYVTPQQQIVPRGNFFASTPRALFRHLPVQRPDVQNTWDDNTHTQTQDTQTHATVFETERENSFFFSSTANAHVKIRFRTCLHHDGGYRLFPDCTRMIKIKRVSSCCACCCSRARHESKLQNFTHTRRLRVV